MADNPQPDAPMPDPDGAGGEVVSEDDLDALLVEASQLASEISGETGSERTDATPASAENQIESDSSDLSSLSCDDIDSQLANLDRLVEETQSEIGVPDAADVPSEFPPAYAATNEVEPGDLSDAGDSTAPNQDDLPDFMSEFTQPATEPPPESETTEPSGLSEPVSKTPAESATGRATTQDAKAKPDESGPSSGKTKATNHAGRQKGVRLIMTRLGHALSPMAFRAADKVVGVLEAVNAPTQRIGIGIRTLVGWLAIATIGTSVLVFLVSLF